MSSEAKATIQLCFSEKQVDTLLSALGPEAKAPPTHRSSVKLEKDGCNLILTVTERTQWRCGQHSTRTCIG